MARRGVDQPRGRVAAGVRALLERLDTGPAVGVVLVFATLARGGFTGVGAGPGDGGSVWRPAREQASTQFSVAVTTAVHESIHGSSAAPSEMAF